MSRRLLLALFATACAALVLQGRALACSCGMYQGTYQQQVQQALNSADFVFVAKIRDVKHYINEEYANWPVTEEYVRFVILEVLKGRDHYFAGQPLSIRSQVAPGLCGIAARNDPAWMMDLRGEGEDEVPTAFSDTWLIYAYGVEPFDLSMCTRSLPLNIRDAQKDVDMLRQLLDRAPPRRPAWETAAYQAAPGTGAELAKPDR